VYCFVPADPVPNSIFKNGLWFGINATNVKHVFHSGFVPDTGNVKSIKLPNDAWFKKTNYALF
jgi:hypothetical protein